MTVVLVLIGLILLIVFVLIFGGANERRRRKEVQKKRIKKQKQLKAEVKRNNKKAKRDKKAPKEPKKPKQRKQYIDLFEEKEPKDQIQKGVTGDARQFLSNNNKQQETINSAEINDILSEDKSFGYINNENEEIIHNKEIIEEEQPSYDDNLNVEENNYEKALKKNNQVMRIILM